MKLNIGCGRDVKDGYVNMDLLDYPGVLVRDVLRGIPFSDNTFEEVVSENFLEHIPQLEVIFVMNEIWRVLKPGGTAHHIIPQAGTMNFNQDPTHVAHWVPETFRYFDKTNPKNSYYDNIKGWNIVKCEVITSGNSLDVILQKPN